MVSQGAVVAPEVDPPAPAASSTGPQRTKQTTKSSRKREFEKMVASKKEGWDLTLVRFQGQLGVSLALDGQLPGGLTPEMALANIYKIVKGDLKNSVSGFFYWILVHRFTNLSIWRQPLQGSKTGEGTRKPRSQEGYLKGLLRTILPAEQVPLLYGDKQIGVMEHDSSVDAYSRREHFFPSFRFSVAD